MRVLDHVGADAAREWCTAREEWYPLEGKGATGRLLLKILATRSLSEARRACAEGIIVDDDGDSDDGRHREPGQDERDLSVVKRGKWTTLDPPLFSFGRKESIESV